MLNEEEKIEVISRKTGLPVIVGTSDLSQYTIDSDSILFYPFGKKWMDDYSRFDMDDYYLKISKVTKDELSN